MAEKKKRRRTVEEVVDRFVSGESEYRRRKPVPRTVGHGREAPQGGTGIRSGYRCSGTPGTKGEG